MDWRPNKEAQGQPLDNPQPRPHSHTPPTTYCHVLAALSEKSGSAWKPRWTREGGSAQGKLAREEHHALLKGMEGALARLELWVREGVPGRNDEAIRGWEK